MEPGKRTALVTGASSGIGAAAVRALAAEGLHTVAAARRIDRCRDLAREVGARRWSSTSPIRSPSRRWRPPWNRST